MLNFHVFQIIISRFCFYFKIFLFSPNIGMPSVPDILPSVTLPKFGIFSVLPVFLGKKEGKSGGKLFDKNGPY